MSATESAPARPRLLDIALEAFAQGAAEQRARRAAAGLPPLPRHPGSAETALGLLLREMLAAIPWDDAAYAAELASSVPDGGPFCSTCLGARWLARRGGPDWSPPLGRCADCLDSTAATQRDQLAAAAGLSEPQRAKTFGTWGHVKAASAALKAVIEWQGRWAVAPEPGDTPWLVLSGERGSGKTHLALAAANALIGRMEPVRWFHTVDLVDLARSRVDGGGAFALRRELESGAPLILDEFGALSTMGTDWAVTGFIEPLLDARYRHRAPTLFTLKAGPAEVRAHISESIGRRMEDPDVCTHIENQAPQWRGKAA